MICCPLELASYKLHGPTHVQELNTHITIMSPHRSMSRISAEKDGFGYKFLRLRLGQNKCLILSKVWPKYELVHNYSKK